MSKQNRKITKKTRVKLYRGIVYIQTGHNNTIVTVTNIKGDVVCWSSAGSSGLKGKRKSSAYAAKLAAANAARKAAREFSLREVKVVIAGPGAARETAIHEIYKAGIKLTVIREKTGIPHNGCRPPKRRRV
uniref:Small ribosomal subunit protein uS11c n=1 Tax=Koshicola spirodelophila TaxID=1707787 RepID=A0A160E7M8_9CHLO|nr:ribosomal protein S11 [Koshicola spirodelophila]